MWIIPHRKLLFIKDGLKHGTGENGAVQEVPAWAVETDTFQIAIRNGRVELAVPVKAKTKIVVDNPLPPSLVEESLALAEEPVKRRGRRKVGAAV